MSRFFLKITLVLGIISCEMIRAEEASPLGQENGEGETVNKISSQSRELLNICKNFREVRRKEGEQGLEKVGKLLDCGADVNAVDDFFWGCTPLHHACESGDKDLVKLLISKGADVNARSAKGGGLYVTPLHAAAFCQFRKICKILLKAGADVNAKDENGSTPLHYAVALATVLYDNPIKILMQYGADTKAVIRSGSIAHSSVPGLTHYIDRLMFYQKIWQKRASKK